MEEKTLTGYPSIDKPWMSFYESVGAECYSFQKPLWALLEECNRDNLDGTAITYHNYGTRLTYKEYFRQIDMYAGAFACMGIKAGDIVPLFMPNTPEARILLYSLNKIGAVAYPVNPETGTKVVEEQLYSQNAETVVMFAGFYDKFKPALDAAGVKNIIYETGAESLTAVDKIKQAWKILLAGDKLSAPKDKKIIHWKEFAGISKNIGAFQAADYVPDSTAVLVGTSGTTGTPKLCEITNENLNAMAIQHLLAKLDYKKGDVMLDILVPFIAYGLSLIHFSGCCGMETHLYPQLLLSGVADVLNEVKPQHFIAGPIHYDEISSASQIIQKPKNAVSGGDELSIEKEKLLNGIDDPKNIDESRVFVRQGYGCTENCGGGTYNKKGCYALGSLGIPLPLTTISIFKPGTVEELRYDQQGEICFTGPAVFKGYFKNDRETQLVLKRHPDGRLWLHTADLGRMDEEGHLFLMDRIKNIFMRKGFNVHPGKISDFIGGFGEVKSCRVIGIPHPIDRMVPVAYIELKDEAKGRENELKQRIETACQEKLSGLDVPCLWIFLPSMPHSIAGKITAKLLIDQYTPRFDGKDRDGDIRVIKFS